MARRDVDVIDAVAEIGDKLELLPRLAEHRGIDPVSDRWYQDIRGLHRFGELTLGHRFVVGIEAGIKKFPHPQLDRIGQLARHDNQRLFRLRHRPSTTEIRGGTAVKAPI